MKCIRVLVCMAGLALSFTQLMMAQSLTNYAFTSGTTAFSSIVGQSGTTELFSTTTASDNDDGYYTAIPINFTFTYMGVPYTSISACANGFALLGGTAVSGSSWVPDLDAGSGTSGRPILAPMWSDQELLSGFSTLAYRTTGAAPNRIFTLEWNSMEYPYSTGEITLSYQMKLYEVSGKVEFIYNQIAAPSDVQEAGVGITNSAAGSGSFLSIIDATFTSVSNTTVNDTLTGVPATGTILTFTPPAAVTAPTNLSFSNIGTTTMTLNWTDNSSTESGYYVRRSTDNNTFTTINTTSANATSYVATGLSGGTTYYWQVIGFNEGTVSSTLSGSQATSSGTMTGTYNIGPGQTFTSIKMALDTIAAKGLAGPSVFELQANYSSAVETYPLNFGAFAGGSATNTVTFRPAANATGLVIAANNATTALDFNGGDYYIIDGRPGGTGTTSQLTITDSSTSATAGTIRIYNDATNNIIRYCTILGASTNTSTGVILMGTAAATNPIGNDNNTISNCTIGPISSSLLPARGIYCSGTTSPVTGVSNKNTITNCNIYDYFIASTTNYGIASIQGYTEWTITNNSLYQTATRTHTASNTIYGIYFSHTTTLAPPYTATISGNFIGGSAPSCGGSAMTHAISTTTLTPVLHNIFKQSVSSNMDSTVISNNTIANINFTTASTSSPAFTGINYSHGTGVMTNNTIGSATATGSIVISNAATSTTGGATACGIFTSTASTGAPFIITGNSIGGFNLASSTATSGNIFLGINISTTVGANCSIANNTIGSSSVANSINAQTTVTGSQQISGISITSASGSAIVTTDGNLIANLTNNAGVPASNTTTGGTQWIRGIVATSGIQTVTNNTVRNLTTTTQAITSSFPSFSIVGIGINSTTAPVGTQGHTVSGNTIHSLVNSATAGTGMFVNALGINCASNSGGTFLVEKNNIHSISTASTAGATNVIGILSFGGSTIFRNNMLRLGYDASGNSLTNPIGFQGITKNGTTPSKFYNNSVYIGGTGVTGTANSFCFWRAGVNTTGVNEEVINNIFQNARTNGTGTGAHLCSMFGNGTNANATATVSLLTMNGNVYYHNGNGGNIGGLFYTPGATIFVYNTMASWKNISFSDAASAYGSPNFVNPSGSATTGDLHINAAGGSVAESGGIILAAVTDDFDGQSRNTSLPADAGADNGTFAAATDVAGPAIVYTPYGPGITGTSRVLGNVLITDVSGVNTTSGTKPRVYYKKSTDANAYAGNNSTDNGWKWVEASNTSSPFSFTVDYTLLQASVAITDTIQYFFTAQDLATTPNASWSPLAFTNAVPTTVAVPNTSFPVAGFNSYTFRNGVSGTINVGPSETINSITNTGGLFEYINNRVVTGNVTALITGNMITEAGTVALNQTVEDGTGNYTITIRPAAGTTDTVRGALSANSLIRFNGADRIIIDGRRPGDATGINLTIQNTNSSAANAAAIGFINSTAASFGCVNDTVRFCNISCGYTTAAASTSYTTGIYLGGTTMYSDFDGHSNIAILNNNIQNVSMGIVSYGLSSFPSNGLTISNNTIGNTATATTAPIHYSGISLRNTVNVVIDRNTIQGITGNISSHGVTGQGTHAIGIAAGTKNVQITNNTIRKIKYGGTGGYEAMGIEVLSGTTNTNVFIANNMISGLSFDGWNSYTDGTSAIRLGVSASINDGITILHNSIILNDTTTGLNTTAKWSSCLYVGSACSRVDVRNNIFRNAIVDNTTAVHAARAISTEAYPSAFTNLNYNDYEVGGPDSTAIAVFGSTPVAYKTLNDWKNFYGRDQNSVTGQITVVDPVGGDLHLNTGYGAVKGTTAMPSTVNNDFDDIARVNYTMGADEVKPIINFSQHPSSTIVCEGQTLNLSGTVSTPIGFNDNITRSAPTLSYQWLKNGTPISGATNSSYSISSVTTTDAGSYTLRTFASAVDSATSNAASVTIYTNASITTQPTGTSSNLCPGNTSFTLSVAASGTTPSYQWQRLVGSTWTNISGATGTTYSPGGGWATSDSGSYRVVVSSTSPCSQSVTSNAVVVGVFTVASISAQPSVTPASSRCLGQNFTLSVTGAGSTLQYQWRKSSVNISGATNATYTVASATAADFGTYDVIVSNSCNSVTSTTVTVTQIAATSITVQPISTPASQCLGQNFTVSVSATGAALTYQWRRGGTNISGATNSSYAVVNAQVADFATYDVIVTGTCGSLTSNTVTVSQIPSTKITTQPTAPTALCVGGNININGLAATGASLTYQWQKQSGATWSAISGATSATYAKSGATVADSGNYRVIVGGTCYADTSVSIVVTVLSPVTITTQPAWSSPNACTGEASTLSVVATGAVASYQWQKFNGSIWNNISGATSASYVLNSIVLGDAGDYRIQINGPCNPALTSNIATLNVQQNVQITSNPQNATVCVGASISMSVTTIGTVVSYQWQQDLQRNGTWVNISGATNATYAKTNVSTSDSGNYRVQIIGTCSATPVNSTAAIVTIQQSFNITSQPTWQSTPTNVGQTVTLTVGYTGTANFQWQRDQQRNNNWTNVGTNSNVYSYTVQSIADSGNYRCIVTGPCNGNSVTTSTASVFTCQPPSITQQPQAPAVSCPGGSFTLSVQVNAQGQTISYQWQQDAARNGTWANISGATNSSYTKNNIQPSDDGNYRVQISSSCAVTPVISDVVSVVVRAPISITGNPVSQTVCQGGSASFSVTATGANPSYQWFFNNSPISSGVNATAVTATLQLTNINSTQQGSYKCFVSGPCTPNGVFSNDATLTVTTGATITTQPVSTTGCAGTPVSLSVVATGSNLTYQWRKGGVNVSGATTATYTISNPTAANSGSYDVVVNSSCGSATSNSVTLTINTPASFTAQPTSQSTCQGGTINVGVSVNSDATNPSYQWQKNGVDINPVLNPTAATATLSLSNVTPATSGNYTCVVKTICQPNGITSSTSVITVYPPTAITTQPQGATLCQGSALTLSVRAEGWNVSYQWRKGGTAIFGANGTSYSIPSVQPSDAGDYDVQVGGLCAPTQVTSSVATVAVNTPVNLTTTLTPRTVCNGANVSYTMTATGSGLTYQWRRNGVAITGNNTATTATLQLNAVTSAQAGTYDCVVSGTCTPNGVASNTSLLTVNTNVVMQTQPANQTVCEGVTVQFTASANGSVTGYQWRFNGVAINGNGSATTPTLILNNVTAGNNGTYDVSVTGLCDVTTSTSATLTVYQPLAITTQPKAQRGCVGSTIVTAITTSGSALAYQWQKDGVDVPGMTTAVLTLLNPTSAASGTYRCVVTGSAACGTPQVISDAVGVVVGLPAVITSQPQDKAVSLGATVTVTVEADGIGFGANNLLSYKWYKGSNQLTDDNRISGSATNQLTIRSIQAGDIADDYTVVVLGACGETTSRKFSLFAPGVNITSQPSTQTVCVGNGASFTVGAAATTQGSVLSYQWYRGTQALSDGNGVSGSTTSTLSITGVAVKDTGDYSVQITVQPGGMKVTSNVVRLNVNQLPQITTQPQATEICVGAALNLQVAASGGTLRYQWQRGGVDINAATNASLSIPSAQSTDAGAYKVIVRNDCGNTTSSEVTITVNTAPTITEQPVNQNVNTGSSFTLKVTATGSAPVTYQWRKGGTDIANATNSTYTKSNIEKTDEGEYTVIVKNGCGEVTSSKATISVTIVSVGDATEYGYLLYAAEPNPVSGESVIRYVLPQAGMIKLTLTDVQGREVAVLVNDIQQQGEHRAWLRLSEYDLASGVYQLTLTTPAGLTTSKRIVVAR